MQKNFVKPGALKSLLGPHNVQVVAAQPRKILKAARSIGAQKEDSLIEDRLPHTSPRRVQSLVGAQPRWANAEP